MARVEAVKSADEGAGSVAVGAESEEIVAANTDREGLTIVNAHASQGLFLGLGGDAVLDSGIYLAPGGGSWDGLISGVLWRGAVNGIATGADTPAAYVEV